MRHVGSIHRSGNRITIGLVTVLIVSFGIFSHIVGNPDDVVTDTQQMVTAQTPDEATGGVNRPS